MEGDVVIDTVSEVVTRLDACTATDGDSLIDTVSEVVWRGMEGVVVIDTVSKAVLRGMEGVVVIDTVSEGVTVLLTAYTDTNTIAAKVIMSRIFFGSRIRVNECQKLGALLLRFLKPA